MLSYKKSRTLIGITITILLIVFIGISKNNNDSIDYENSVEFLVEEKLGEGFPSTEDGSSEKNKVLIFEDGEVLFRAKPFESYLNLIPRADSGDRNAQFEISTILEECSIESFTDISQIEELELARKISTEIASYWKSIYNECINLYEFLDKHDLSVLSEAWNQTAAENNHPIAKLYSAFNYPELPEKDEALKMVYDALGYLPHDPISREESIRLAVKYYAYYIESQNDQRNIIERNAWDLLSCLSDNRCDQGWMRAQMDQHFSPYEVSESINRLEEISMAINNKDWKILGF